MECLPLCFTFCSPSAHFQISKSQITQHFFFLVEIAIWAKFPSLISRHRFTRSNLFTIACEVLCLPSEEVSQSKSQHCSSCIHVAVTLARHNRQQDRSSLLSLPVFRWACLIRRRSLFFFTLAIWSLPAVCWEWNSQQTSTECACLGEVDYFITKSNNVCVYLALCLGHHIIEK